MLLPKPLHTMPICYIPCKRRGLFAAAVMIAVAAVAPAAIVDAQSDRSHELQQLIEDLGYQLDLVQQFDRREAQRRLQQLGVAIDRWNDAPRNAADFQTMRTWLKQATRATMPGSSKAMPELPTFSQRVVRAKQPVATQPPDESAVQAPPPPTAGQSENVAATPQREAREAAGDSSPLPASVWQRHPASKPIDADNPFLDDAPVASQVEESERVVMRPTGLAVPPERERVAINLAELSARIRGYARGLRAVEARLIASPEMKPEELLRTTRELKQLAAQREFVSLYVDALSPNEQMAAPELPEYDNAKRMVAARLSRLKREPGTSDAFDELFAESESLVVETIESMLDQI